MQEPTRLTPTSFIVLGLIEQVGVATPYQLKRLVGLSVGYFWSLQHAQLYSEPERLAAAGYLDVEREDSGRRRKRYSLTRRGREALDAWRAEPAAQPAEMREPALLKLFFGADPSCSPTRNCPPIASAWPSTSASASRFATRPPRATGSPSRPGSVTSASGSVTGRTW